jgi:hypothetical protein
MADNDRRERLKAALRDNLKRRKAQVRGREADKDRAEDRAPGPDPGVERKS